MLDGPKMATARERGWSSTSVGVEQQVCGGSLKISALTMIRDSIKLINDMQSLDLMQRNKSWRRVFVNTYNKLDFDQEEFS